MSYNLPGSPMHISNKFPGVESLVVWGPQFEPQVQTLMNIESLVIPKVTEKECE